jgi:general secretion pathway protein K
VVTVLAVELAYDTRVSLRIASNARDELRASYQARAAVALGRLVLHFQQRLDTAGALASQALTSGVNNPLRNTPVGRPGVPAVAPTPTPGGTPSFSFRLWDAIPIDSVAMVALLGSDRPRVEGAPGKGVAPPAGAPNQSFQAIIEDEDRKVNVAQLAGLSTVAAPQLQRFLLALRDPRYDVLFDREDANGNRFSRKDVAVALKDWVDEDATTSTIGVNPAAPFENGFGDENLVYDRGDDRYRAKNARFDSLDELYMVAGIGDAFMAAFGDHLTVYPDVNGQTNINTSDPQQMLVNALLMSDPPGVPQPPMLDPAFPQKLDLALRLARPLPFMTITVQQFATVLQALGVKVQPLFLQAQNTDTRSAFGNRSSTFTIRATGRAGEVEKTIEAVVTTDNRAGPLASDLGRLIHWRED